MEEQYLATLCKYCWLILKIHLNTYYTNKKKFFQDLTINKLIVQKGLRSYNNQRNMSSAYCVCCALCKAEPMFQWIFLGKKKSRMLSRALGGILSLGGWKNFGSCYLFNYYYYHIHTSTNRTFYSSGAYLYIYISYKGAPKMGSQPAKCLQMSPNVSIETFRDIFPYYSSRLPWYLLSKSQNVGGAIGPQPPYQRGPWCWV